MIALEDSYLDVVGKTQRGTGVTDEALAEKCGVSVSEIAAFKAGSGALNEALLAKVAGVLSLREKPLLALARGEYKPDVGAVPAELLSFNTEWSDMTVNNYVVYDAASRKAVMFDAGADAKPALDAIKALGLELELLLLTHSHTDHVAGMDLVFSRTQARAYMGELEPYTGNDVERFAAGKRFQVGALSIETRLTWGHAKGGITFVVSGLSRGLAIVGDAVFAGSMGGGQISFAEALRTNLEEIYSLPEETVLCPGHGPLTTVALEKVHNPFYC